MSRSVSCLLMAAGVVLAACGETDPNNPPDPGGNQEPVGDQRIPAYLRGNPYTRLVLELDATEGFAPRATVENAVVDTVRAVVDKPGGVSVVKDQLMMPRKGSTYEWTFEELDQLAKDTFTLRPGPSTVRMHIMFLDGQYKQGNVLGLAWGHTHLAIFKETIERGCRSGLGSTLGDRVCEAAEQGVWVHEVGHLLGLVNNGLPMAAPHQDAAHLGHDSNDRCVMFWAFDTSSSLDKLARELLGGESVSVQFDDACKADLAAGRAAP